MKTMREKELEIKKIIIMKIKNLARLIFIKLKFYQGGWGVLISGRIPTFVF